MPNFSGIFFNYSQMYFLEVFLIHRILYWSGNLIWIYTLSNSFNGKYVFFHWSEFIKCTFVKKLANSLMLIFLDIFKLLTIVLFVCGLAPYGQICRILIENQSASEAGCKNDLSIAPITNFYILANIFLSYLVI